MTEANVFQPVDSLQVAAYIVQKCAENDIDVNVTKLQKLMYCCYGTVLAKFGARLIDERPAALQYGPVFMAALKTARYFGLGVFKNSDVSAVAALPASVRELIGNTIDSFGKFSATKLSQWSHLPGSPWSRASLGGDFLGVPLSDEDVREYFATQVLKQADDE